MTFQRILLLNRNHIGDCLFTTPAIRALRTAYPEAVLVAAVPPVNRDLLESNPCLSEVLVRPLRGVVHHWRLLQEIRRRQFDLVISFQEKSFFYAALARLSGARLTVSLQHWRTQPFYHRIVPAIPEHHEVERYHAIAQAVLGPQAMRDEGRGMRDEEPISLIPRPSSLIPRRPGAMELHVSLDHRAKAEALLANLGMTGDAPLIGINPGASMKSKRWPTERFAAVAGDLAAGYDARILVLGGSDDEGRAAAIARAVPGALSVAGRTRLGETAALLRRCRLLVSGDTGPLHMAVALGIPSIGLFGPTDPERYGPWGQRGEGRRGAVVLRHPHPCPRCSRPCVHTITVEECLSAANLLLGGANVPSLPSRVEERVPAAGTAV
jgi:ADP-heptose:LPS heptosyltransferase